MHQLCPRQAQSHLINMQSQRRETGDFRDYRRNRRGLGRSQETSKIVNARNIASKSTQPGLRKLARLSKFRASFPSHFPTASRIILPLARPQRRTCDSAGGRRTNMLTEMVWTEHAEVHHLVSRPRCRGRTILCLPPLKSQK